MDKQQFIDHYVCTWLATRSALDNSTTSPQDTTGHIVDTILQPPMAANAVKLLRTLAEADWQLLQNTAQQ